jgi:hypothetical protein
LSTPRDSGPRRGRFGSRQDTPSPPLARPDLGRWRLQRLAS